VSETKIKERDLIGRLWKEMSGDLRSFIRARAPAAEVEDILQESFLKIHGKMGSLKEKDKVVSWVYQIVRHTLIDHLRRRRPHLPLEEESAVELPPLNGNIDRKIGKWLVGMVDSLPRPYREAVRLVELEGVPQKEAGQRLGLSLSGAKSRTQRGRKMLKERLTRCCHVEFDRRGSAIDVKPIKSTCCT
jgi:RNA polymerase sigma-70 factor, ECF subfamily